MLPRLSRRAGLLSLGAAVLLGFGAGQWLIASDHKDGPVTGAHPPIDIADLYAFRSPSNPENLVLVMDVRGFIPPAEAASTRFDPRLLYQFMIDTDGDAVEDQIIQAQAVGTGADQQIRFRGLAPPPMTGSAHQVLPTEAVSVRTTTTGEARIATGGGLRVFAGVRDDPFFFDFARFQQIRQGKAESFRVPGMDTFAGTNVLSLVVEFPISVLGGVPRLGVWGSVSLPGLVERGLEVEEDKVDATDVYDQADRMGWPGVAVFFIPKPKAPAYNRLAPAADPANYRDEIIHTIVEEYGRPHPDAVEIATMLTPDILPIDVSKPTEFPNGRWLGDDVVNAVLMKLFEDNQGLTEDNVASNDKPFLNTFPYLAPPHTR